MFKASRIKACRRCKKYLPVDSFKLHISPLGQHRRREVCIPCRNRECGPYTCEKCREKLPVEAFGFGVNGQRHKRCAACIEVVCNREKKCRSCQVLKKNTEYPRVSNGSFSSYCIPCQDKPGRGLSMARLPQDCMQCGDAMYGRQEKSAEKQRKYCSRTCFNAANRFGEGTCRQCRKTLPRSSFATRQKYGQRCLICLECRDAIRAGRMTERAGLTAFNNILNMAKTYARRLGCPEPYSRRQIQEMIDGPCYVCGGDVECGLLLDFAGPLDATNFKPGCERCRVIKGARAYEEMLAWAQLVVKEHAGRSPTLHDIAQPRRALDGSETYGQQLARSFSGKRLDGSRAKREQLIPPHVQNTGKLGETFEQKLARYAKQRAEIAEAGKKAKPEDDAHAV